MSLQRDRLRQNVKGGGVLKLRQLYPTATDTFSVAGYLGGTDFADTHTNVEQKDERGQFIDLNSSGNVVTLDSVLKQTTKEEMDLIRTAMGKYWEIYYPALLANGNTQELVGAICKIDPTLKKGYKPGEQTIPIKIYFLAPGATFVRNPTAYNITADASGQPWPYVLTEGAVANGEPQDAAADVWTGVK